MSHYDSFWHIDAYENITSPVCSTVFVQSKTENQLTSRDALMDIRIVNYPFWASVLIRFVIAYLLADNNVKRETVAATWDPRLQHSRCMAS